MDCFVRVLKIEKKLSSLKRAGYEILQEADLDYFVTEKFERSRSHTWPHDLLQLSPKIFAKQVDFVTLDSFNQQSVSDAG